MEPHLASQEFPFLLSFFLVTWTKFAWPEQIHSFQQVQKQEREPHLASQEFPFFFFFFFLSFFFLGYLNKIYLTRTNP